MARRSGSPTRRVALITGGASGIGLATAHRLARRGDALGLVDLDGQKLDDVLREIRKSGGTARVLQADVLDGEAMKAFATALSDEFGSLSYAFANAGVDRRRPVTEMDVDDWRVVVDSHVTGSFNLCQAALPHMVRAGNGALLLMASDFAITGLRGQANYTAAKTAVYSLTKALAIEFAPAGVRVNAVGPGPIDTPLLRAGRTGPEWETGRATVVARVPMGRLGTADEVGATAEFLLSDRSSYITGQLLQPNGGQVIW